MSPRKVYALVSARNKEFFRDKASFLWNLVFPFVIIIGFSFIFSGRSDRQYKVGTFGQNRQTEGPVKRFLGTRYIQFVEYASLEEALPKLRKHQLDLFVDLSGGRYWLNSTSPKGYILEKLLRTSESSTMERKTVEGREIRYVDWLLPGILGMNMMFSCLFGVGFVIVRYRKNGVLKRFSAAPLSAFDFLMAQVLSRFLVSLSVTVVVFIGCKYAIGFHMEGSYLLLLLVCIAGILCLISLGVLVACRSASEEFAGGIINLASWPMMFLSGVWFSLEGSPEWVVRFSKLLPLTHIIVAARNVMNDGAGWGDVLPNLVIVLAMTGVFLAIGSAVFRWDRD